MFDHSDVDKVHFLGFRDEEDMAFVRSLEMLEAESGTNLGEPHPNRTNTTPQVGEAFETVNDAGMTTRLESVEL